MDTFTVDPDHARLLTAELLDAADHLPATPLPAPGRGRFSASLHAAVTHLDVETRRVHDGARVLAEHSHRVIDAAECADHSLAAHLGRLR